MNKAAHMNKKPELKEILDIEAIQNLMNDFYLLTNFGIGIIDLHGEVLVATGWQDICTMFHRNHVVTQKYCIESDLYLTGNIKKGDFLEYRCKNNLRDIVTPIFIDNDHAGNIFFGQFFYEDEDIDELIFKGQAELYGFNKEKYLESLKKVPRFSRSKVKTAMEFYSKFAGIISSLIYTNFRLQTALEENKVAIADLKRSNKDLERYAFALSHDLKEPLRMISGYTQLFLKTIDTKNDTKAEQYASYIIEGVKRMYNLIDDIIKYSYLVSPGPKEKHITDCNEVIKEVQMDLKLAIDENNAAVHFNTLPIINMNHTQIRLVFQNLIENAIKFKSEKDPEIFISCIKSNGGWLFSVKDNGIGIAPEYQEKIFDLFVRLNNRQKFPGTGIGLAECRRILEQNGGRIWVESELGVGSTFHFLIQD